MWSGHNCCGMRSCGMSGWSIGQLPLQALYQGPAALTAVLNLVCVSSALSGVSHLLPPLPMWTRWHYQNLFLFCLTCYHGPSQRLPGGASWLPALSSGPIIMVLMCGANLKQWTAQVHFLLVRKCSFFSVSLVILAFFSPCNFLPWVTSRDASGMQRVWHVLTQTQRSAAGQRVVQGLS